MDEWGFDFHGCVVMMGRDGPTPSIWPGLNSFPKWRSSLTGRAFSSLSNGPSELYFPFLFSSQSSIDDQQCLLFIKRPPSPSFTKHSSLHSNTDHTHRPAPLGCLQIKEQSIYSRVLLFLSLLLWFSLCVYV